MSGEVLAFPTRAGRAQPMTTVPPAAVGDIILMCVNATLDLWCAWPVAAVDDDGVVIGVTTKAGRMVGAERLNCLPDVYGFRAVDHQAEAFEALRWKTWRDPGEALLAFARIGERRCPSA